MDIQRIPDSVPDDQLEEKVAQIFNQINAKINRIDIEDCHRMGKFKKTSIVCLVVVKDVVNIRGTMNERPIAITHNTGIASLYPDIFFKEKTRSG